MSWLLLVAALIALFLAYHAGRNKGHAEGIVAGVLIAQANEPDDPLSAFVGAQRDAAKRGAQ